ncbi:MAG: monovalent cation:proton antiporter family protein [Nitriliruptorales bacterium]
MTGLAWGTVLAQTQAPPDIRIGNFLLVLLSAWIAGRLVERIGFPAILGELLVGILLGPALLGILTPGAALDVIAELGIILMMVTIGMHVEASDLRRASVPGLLAAGGGFVVPFGVGYVTVLLFGGDAIAALLVASTIAVTSIVTKSRILSDLQLFETRIAYVLMAGALVSDTAALVVLSAIIAVVELGGFDLAATARVGAEALGFFVVVGLLALGPARWFGRWLQRRRIRDRNLLFMIVVAVTLLFAEIAELAGLHAVLGAFVAGMVVRESILAPRDFRSVEGLLDTVSIRFLAPVFFVTAGFGATFDVFRTDLLLLVTILLVAVLGKAVGTALLYLPTGHGWREGLTVGAAMNSRGGVDIVVATIGFELGLISQEIFTVLILVAITATATVPVLLTLGVRWLRRRGELARTESQRRGVILVGAGPTARAVAHEMLSSRPVMVVDANAARCRQAQEEGIPAVHGDVLDEETLRDAEADKAGALLALTTNAEVNLLAARLASELFGVGAVQAAVGSSLTRSRQEMLEGFGGGILYGRPIEIHLWDLWLELGQTRRETVSITAATPVEEITERIEAGDVTLPLAVKRGDEMLVFPSTGLLETGDEIRLLVRSDRWSVPLAEPLEKVATA